jgi:exodeoxyribonuclease-3
MKLATWNVNSIKQRKDRALQWLSSQRPQVLCLQELKTEDAGFPLDEIRALGYHAAIFGQKTYNGVAILSTEPLEKVERNIPGFDDPQARLIAATTHGVRVVCGYFPNGQRVGSDKYAYKLAWLEKLRLHLLGEVARGGPLALLGDFNVAPEDLDVHDPAAWEGQLLCSPPEREALAAIRALGLVDVVRHARPGERFFSWWDYRGLSFPKNVGLRIDHIYTTPDLAGRVLGAGVDREARKGQQPSDHAPVWAEFGAA